MTSTVSPGMGMLLLMETVVTYNWFWLLNTPV